MADGVPVPIGTKALGILATLVEAEGHLVTKDELMDRVWPGLVVEEHNIQVHVSALRKVLGSDAGWIRTVPRLGYRFAGPMTMAQSMARPLAVTLQFGRRIAPARTGIAVWSEKFRPGVVSIMRQQT
jgi:non-specific serine/threonine protein kinase